jgi:hypothetical protein
MKLYATAIVSLAAFLSFGQDKPFAPEPRPFPRPWPVPVAVDQFTLVDKEGTEHGVLRASETSPFSEGLAAFRRDGKWGYVNREGEEVIPPTYASADAFHDGWAVVGPLQIINADGDSMALDPGIQEVRAFSEKFAAAKKDDAWGFINTEGKFVIKPRFSEVGRFSEQRAAFRNEKGWGYIDKRGKKVIKPHLERRGAGPFRDGVAVVKQGGERLIDLKGKLLGEQTWDEIGLLSEGFAPVRKGEKVGLIDKTGKVVLPATYLYIGTFAEGVAPARKNTWSKTGYIDAKGAFVIGEQYEEAYAFVDGVATIRKRGTWGCIDRKGNYVLQLRQGVRVDFSEERAFVPLTIPGPGPGPRPQPIPLLRKI